MADHQLPVAHYFVHTPSLGSIEPEINIIAAIVPRNIPAAHIRLHELFAIVCDLYNCVYIIIPCYHY